MFDDEFYTVTLITEDKIPPNCTDLVQGSSQSGAPDNIYLKDTWFTLDIEEYPSKNPTHVPRVEPEIPVREGVWVSEVIKHINFPREFESHKF